MIIPMIIFHLDLPFKLALAAVVTDYVDFSKNFSIVSAGL